MTKGPILTKATATPEQWALKLKQQREYKERKRKGETYQPKFVSPAFLARQELKNKKRNATKKEDFCPEAYARKLETNRLSRERRKKADPEKYAAKLRESAKKYYASLPEAERQKKNRDKRLSRERNAVPRQAAQPFAASVALAAAPSHWRDVLLEVSRLVGFPYERDDIIAEAMLLTVEGFTISEAVAQAKRKVNYETNKAQRALSLDQDGFFEPVDMLPLGAYV